MKQLEENTLGNRIRQARQKSGYKVKELAKVIGISANYAGMIELGSRNPSDELLYKIAEITKTTYDWLKTGEGQPYIYDKPQRASHVTASAPDPQLLLVLLKRQRPELFPDFVRTILDVSPETLERLMDGSANYEPRWRYAFSLLAQRMDRDAVRDAFRSLDAYLDTAQISSNVFQRLHTALLRYLDAEGYREYKIRSEQSCAEQYAYEGIEMQIHVLSLAEDKRYGETVWDFKYVDADPLPNDSVEVKGENDMPDDDNGCNIVSEIIDAQLDYLGNNPTERVSFVFSDEAWYDEFVHYLDKLSGTASERNRSPELMGRMSLLLTDAGMERVGHVTRGDDYYV